MASMNLYQEKLEQWAKVTMDTLYDEKQEQKQKQMEKQYKVVKLNELASSLKLPPNSGMKSNEYLELLISEIERRGYRFVQFLQLVDVLYVIIDVAGLVTHVTLPPEKFRPEEEIAAHYNPSKKERGKKAEPPMEKKEKFEEALEAVKSRDHLDKNMSGVKLPWKK